VKKPDCIVLYIFHSDTYNRIKLANAGIEPTINVTLFSATLKDLELDVKSCWVAGAFVAGAYIAISTQAVCQAVSALERSLMR
jgi:hypothetical protein